MNLEDRVKRRKRKFNKKLSRYGLGIIILSSALIIGIKGCYDEHKDFIRGTYIHLKEHVAQDRKYK